MTATLFPFSGLSDTRAIDKIAERVCLTKGPVMRRS